MLASDMGDYHIEYSPESQLNLEKIAQYYVDVLGYEQAMNLMKRIFVAIDSLSFMPMRCPKVHWHSHIHKLVVPSPPYVAYFTISQNPINRVEILQIMHGSKSDAKLIAHYQGFTAF